MAILSNNEEVAIVAGILTIGVTATYVSQMTVIPEGPRIPHSVHLRAHSLHRWNILGNLRKSCRRPNRNPNTIPSDTTGNPSGSVCCLCCFFGCTSSVKILATSPFGSIVLTRGALQIHGRKKIMGYCTTDKNEYCSAD